MLASNIKKYPRANASNIEINNGKTNKKVEATSGT